MEAKDSDHIERVSLWKEMWNTHFPAVMGTECAQLFTDLSGCFLPSFSGHHTPLHLLTLEELRERCVWSREPKEPEMNKGENQHFGWEKSAGRRRQAWNSDRQKVMRKDKKKQAWIQTQAEDCCFVVVLGRDLGTTQALGTTILLQSAMVCRTHWEESSSLQQPELLKGTTFHGFLLALKAGLWMGR